MREILYQFKNVAWNTSDLDKIIRLMKSSSTSQQLYVITPISSLIGTKELCMKEIESQWICT